MSGGSDHHASGEAHSSGTRVKPRSITASASKSNAGVWQVGLTLVGLIFLVLIGASVYKYAMSAKNSRGAVSSESSISSQGICNYLRQPTVFGTTKPSSPQNPGGSCGVDLFYDGDPGLYATSAGSNVVHGPIHRGEELPLDAEYIWSASTPFNGAFKLVAARYH